MLAGVRLVVDLLFHEVPVVALFHQGGGGRDDALWPGDAVAGGVEDAGAVVVDGDEIALVQIGDAVGEGAHRQGVGADEHFADAMAHHQGTAAAGAHDQLVLAVDEDTQRKGAGQAVQGGLERNQRVRAPIDVVVQELGDDLGVGVALEGAPLGLQLLAQLGIVLNDPVMHQGDSAGPLGVGVALGRGAVGGPAGVADADGAEQGVLVQHGLQGADLALGAAAFDMVADHGGDAGGVVAAVLESFEAVDQTLGHRLHADDANDAAHALAYLSETMLVERLGPG